MMRTALATEIERLRARIDAVNGELLRLLERRAELTLAVARAKRERDIEFRDPERETLMLAAILAQSRGLYDRAEIEAVFERIFAVSRSFASRALASPR